MIEFKIDYIQFSGRAKVKASLVSGHGFDFKSNNRFYGSMRKYENGLVVYSGNPNTDKQLFVLSGKACDAIGVRPDTLDRFEQFEPEYSRIDLAMTTDRDVLTKIMKDKDKVKSKMFPDGMVIADLEYTPQTIYFGDLKKRARKGIVRCYDKGLQLGLSEMWHRIEIEYRQKHAKTAVKRILNGSSIQSVMNSKWMIEADWYTEMMGDEVSTTRFTQDEHESELTDIERKMLWIEKQVLPSLQYIIDYDRANGTNNFSQIISKLY